MKNNLFFRIILLITIMILPAYAFAISEAACIFLLIEPSSRSGGMGQAHVAQVDDAFAGYWNAGAMAFNRKPHQLALMHTNWLGDVEGIDDIYIEYLAWNGYQPDLEGNLGFHIIYLTYGSQEFRDENGDWIRDFVSWDLAAAATYAYQMTENLGIGSTFKFIYSNLSPKGQGDSELETKGQGMSFAFDIALLKKNLLIDKLDLGVNLQNIGPNITYINKDQADPLPMNLRLGFSYRLIESETSQMAINADMNKLLANDDNVFKRMVTAWYDDGGFLSRTERESTIFGIGTEFLYWNLLAGRVGYIYDKAGHIKGPSFGAGIQYTFSQKYKTKFDFAFQPAGEMTKWNKTFSLGLEF